MSCWEFANTRGLSTQHYLIKMIVRIISATDNSTKGECVSSCPGFSHQLEKSFSNAMSHSGGGGGVKSFIKNGIRVSKIPVIEGVQTVCKLCATCV